MLKKTINMNLTYSIDNSEQGILIFNLSGKILSKEDWGNNFVDNYLKILKVMTPVIPHFTNECIGNLISEKNLKWPKVDKKYLNIKKYTIIVQINGKKRSILKAKNDMDEKYLFQMSLELDNVKKFLENKKIIKKIYVKNKLINFVVHD